MNITVEKRFLSFVLSFILVLSLVPASVIEVHAAGLSETVMLDGISVSSTDENNLGTANNSNGSLTFTIKAEKSSCTGAINEKTHTVTIKNTTTADVAFSFKYVATNSGGFTLNGDTA